MTHIGKAPVPGPAGSARYWRERVRPPNPWPQRLLFLLLVLLAGPLIFCAIVTGALIFDCCIGSAPP